MWNKEKLWLSVLAVLLFLRWLANLVLYRHLLDGGAEYTKVSILLPSSVICKNVKIPLNAASSQFHPNNFVEVNNTLFRHFLWISVPGTLGTGREHVPPFPTTHTVYNFLCFCIIKRVLFNPLFPSLIRHEIFLVAKKGYFFLFLSEKWIGNDLIAALIFLKNEGYRSLRDAFIVLFLKSSDTDIRNWSYYISHLQTRPKRESLQDGMYHKSIWSLN